MNERTSKSLAPGTKVITELGWRATVVVRDSGKRPTGGNVAIRYDEKHRDIPKCLRGKLALLPREYVRHG